MTDPASFLAYPVVALRDLVAASATFQTWVGAANAAAALPRSHITLVGNKPLRPMAIVDWSTLALERYTLGQRTTFEHKQDANALSLWFEAAALGLNDDEGELVSFANTVGTIVDEISKAVVVQRGSQIVIREFEMVTRPTRAQFEKRTTEGDLLICEWLVSFTRAM